MAEHQKKNIRLSLLSSLHGALSNSESYNHIYHLIFSAKLPHEVSTVELHNSYYYQLILLAPLFR